MSQNALGNEFRKGYIVFMKKTAKILCLLLAVLMLATLAAACETETGETSTLRLPVPRATKRNGFRLRKKHGLGVTLTSLP